MARRPIHPLDDATALLASFRAQMTAAGYGDHASPTKPSPGPEPKRDGPSASGPRADPRLLTLVENRLRPEIARSHRLPRYAKELPLHLDPKDWGAGFLEVSEGGAPLEVREGMRTCTPQALLRDLHRPLYSTAPVPLELRELPLDPGARAASAELRAARRHEPPPVLPRSTSVVAELQAERRAFLSAPWKPHLDDSAPRREVFVPVEPSLSL